MERGKVTSKPLVDLLLFAVYFCCCVLQIVSLLSSRSSSCPDSRAPVALGKSSLTFCDMVSGSSCCHAQEDAALQKEFEAMRITDAACATKAKRILCEECLPSPLAHQFNTMTMVRQLIPPQCASPLSSSPTVHRRRTSAVSSSPQQEAACLGKIAAGTYNRMAAHPDGSSRMFLSTEEGEIWLAMASDDHARGSGSALQMNDSPFLDITDRVLQLVGIAFHPEFTTNGRFIVSYTCDSNTMPNCTTSCSSAAGNGSMPSHYHLVVAEFTAKAGGHDYAKATRADPAEVRRVFSMALPLQHQYTSYNNHIGQILFWSGDDNDGYYLFLVLGHVGDEDHCKDMASYCGKILKFNVDDNSTPPKMEILAVGLSKPMGCSFDSERPSNMYCANVNQEQFEQVYLISNVTGNNNVGSSSNMTLLVVIDHSRSVTSVGAPSIMGGRVYRGTTDPSMSGRYLFMYGPAMQGDMVDPPESILPYATASIPTICCSGTAGTTCIDGTIGQHQVLFLGEDNDKNLVVLTTGGVFLLLKPAFCIAPPPPMQHSQSSSNSWWVGPVLGAVVAFLLALLWKLALWVVNYCRNRNEEDNDDDNTGEQQLHVNITQIENHGTIAMRDIYIAPHQNVS